MHSLLMILFEWRFVNNFGCNWLDRDYNEDHPLLYKRLGLEG